MLHRRGLGSLFSSSASPSLKLTKDEERKLARFDAKIAKLERQRLSRLRELARQKGITALELKNLKSKCGKPFIEETGRDDYKRATARDEKGSHRLPELAYLCASKWEIASRIIKGSCGWVKGEPIEENYDNIGPLCGSAGKRFFCTICGKMIGEFQERVS